MKNLVKQYIRIVDAVNEKMKYVGLLYVPMSLIMIWEVFSRFALNHPTTWAWDVNTQIQVFTAVMSGGYCLLLRGHVRMDIFYCRWKPRNQAVADIATSFLSMMFLGVLTYQLFDIAREAVMRREAQEGLMHAPLYPLRVMMLAGAALFLLQILADLFRNLLVLTTKQENQGGLNH